MYQSNFRCTQHLHSKYQLMKSAQIHTKYLIKAYSSPIANQRNNGAQKGPWEKRKSSWTQYPELESDTKEAMRKQMEERHRQEKEYFLNEKKAFHNRRMKIQQERLLKKRKCVLMQRRSEGSDSGRRSSKAVEKTLAVFY